MGKQHKTGTDNTQSTDSTQSTTPPTTQTGSNSQVQSSMGSEGPVPRTEQEVKAFVLSKHPECEKYVNAEKTKDPVYEPWVAELKAMKPGDKANNKARANEIMGESLKYGREQRPKEAEELRGMYLTMEEYETIWQQQLQAEGVDLKTCAQLAFMHRNTRKMFTRDLMSDELAREVLDLRNIAIYGSADSVPFDEMVEDKLDSGMTEDEAYLDIIGSARKSSDVANEATGHTH